MQDHRLPTAARTLALMAAFGLALVAAPRPAVAEAPQPIDHELDKYWNVELAVPTLQNPRYGRAGGFEAAVGAGVVPNDSYYLPLPLSLRLGYHMTETLALELSASYLVSSTSELMTFLETSGAGGRSLLENVVKPPKMFLLSALDLVYSPFHGKVGVFDQKLSSFDVGLVVGVGLIGVETDETEAEDAMKSSYLPAGHWGLALRFFATRWLNVRADVRQFAYKPGESLLFPVEITLGVSVLSR
jgi:outer membrane beta-barrel protein